MKNCENKICLINVFIGSIPSWMNLFFDSCKWNPQFDFFLFCDHDFEYELPKNVKVFHLTLMNFITRVNDRLEINVKDLKPYKLCDFKPAYGEIFSDYISNYMYWGICDTDLIFGNLNTFITQPKLEKYDKYYSVGHLSFIKNDPEIVTAFKRKTKNSRDYRKIFSNPNSAIFDECRGFNESIEESGYRLYKNREACEITTNFGRVDLISQYQNSLIQPYSSYKKYYCPKNYRYQVFALYKGHILQIYIRKGTIGTKEYSYAHKIEFKTPEHIDKDTCAIIGKDRLILADDFFERYEQGKLTKKDFVRYNPLTASELKRIPYYARLILRNMRKKFFPTPEEKEIWI